MNDWTAIELLIIVGAFVILLAVIDAAIKLWSAWK